MVFQGQVMGIDLEFRRSSLCANDGVHNINLLGTNFMDQFMIIDEQSSDTLILVQRPVARQPLHLRRLN